MSQMFVTRAKYVEIMNGLMRARAYGVTELQSRLSEASYVQDLTGQTIGPVELVVVADDDPRRVQSFRRSEVAE